MGNIVSYSEEQNKWRSREDKREQREKEVRKQKDKEQVCFYLYVALCHFHICHMHHV